MLLSVLVVFLPGLYPCWLAWRANQRTSLRYTVSWLLLAWLGWGVALSEAALAGLAGPPLLLYLALALTCCAGVAVLGARLPGAAAWNYVVLALLAVLLWPLLGFGLLGRAWGEYLVLLYGLTLVLVVNYLPTRLGGAAILLGTACGVGLEMLRGTPSVPLLAVSGGALALTPWAAWWCWGRVEADSIQAFPELWCSFRDRYGMFWAQRVREQFNRSAANAGWPVQLQWWGLRTLVNGAPEDAPKVYLTTLQALLKRFGMADDQGKES